MAWIKRHNTSSGAQNDYLNTVDTATRPMAIPSLLLTLVIIGAIALLLLSTGRWLYYRINTPSGETATTSENQPNNEAGQPNQSEQSVTSSAQETAGTQPQTQSGTGTATSQGSQQATGASQTASTQANTPAITPNTGATPPETVPNTGTGSVLTYSALVSVIATMVAYGWQIVRNRAW